MGANPLIEVVGTGGEAHLAAELARRHLPDVVLLDADCSGGADAVREIVAVSPQTRTVALAATYELPAILEMLKCGAVGFATKEPAISLPQIIEFVMDDQAILPRRVITQVISELVSALKESEVLARRMNDFERMKGELVDLLSHELRTPITIIQGSTVLLTRRASPLSDKEREELNATIQRATARIARAAGNVSAAAGLSLGGEEPPIRSEEIGSLINRATKEFALTASRLRVAAKTWVLEERVWAAPDLGPRALILVIENALDLSPKKQPVDIEVQSLENEIEVRISDRGPGIPKENRGRIFDAFVRGPWEKERQRPGLGLGLYLARRIMEAQKGGISFEPRPGGGSTFILSFRRSGG